MLRRKSREKVKHHGDVRVLLRSCVLCDGAVSEERPVTHFAHEWCHLDCLQDLSNRVKQKLPNRSARQRQQFLYNAVRDHVRKKRSIR